MTNMNDDANFPLETIVSGQPVLLVQDGDFGQPPAEWEVLNAKREMLKGIFSSVGRLGLDNGAFIGTAFLVGDGVLMTNRHVLEGITRLQGAKLVFKPGVSMRVDYREKHESTTPGAVVSEVLGVHRQYDLALLRVDMTDAPPVLTVASVQPGNVRGEVAVVGYPAFDVDEPADLQNEIFQGIFGVKRLQPGKARGLRGNPVVFGHDCSTLGGNSGSCVIDLETGHVIGLHFGGTATTGNQAVPLWNLVNDSPLKRRVNFADGGSTVTPGRRRPVHS
jgi:S1-C subfamily serine protease